MSHNIVQFSGQDVRMIVTTIINYTAGGETILVTEINNCHLIDGFVLGSVASNQNSLGVPLIPMLVSGKIVLFQLVGGALTEIPTTNNLNAVFSGIIHVGING